MATATKAKHCVTPLQLRVWRYMLSYQSKHGCPPTFIEMSKGAKLASLNTVTFHVRALVHKGLARELGPLGAHRRYEAIPEPKEQAHASTS